MRTISLAILWVASLFSHAIAQDYPNNPPPLIDRLTPEILQKVYPGATKVQLLDDGGPTAAEVFVGDEKRGYVYSTLDVIRAPGYSATPFDALAGVTLDGVITGAIVVFHREPYLLNDDRRTKLLHEFMDSLVGMKTRSGGGEFTVPPNYVAGATISARAMRAGVLEAGNLVIKFRQTMGSVVVTEPTPDIYSFRPLNSAQLIETGAVARKVITNGELAGLMKAAGLEGLNLEVRPLGYEEDVYLDLRVGYANPPNVGRNGAGQYAYDQYLEQFPAGSHMLVMGSLGVYDFRGSKYRNITHDFRLERLAVKQEDRVYEFKADQLIAANYELGRVANLIVMKPDSGFDPMKPWTTEVYAYARNPDGTLQQFLLTSVDYTLPDSLILFPEVEPPPVWLEAWVEGRTDVIILGVALTLLTLIIAFQGRLTRSRRLHAWVRNGFLAFTLVWVGWIASAQLSLVNVINAIKGPIEGLSLGFYLAEPLIFIISIYTLISVILIGRGVFCGWLCPFGALQELLAKVARFLKLPEWNPSANAQKYLWNIKYVVLFVVVGLVFTAPAIGAVAEEVEPFKTAITAMFNRGWPYVVYAVILLMIGLFSERFFCRFVCPLGAGLAILDRLHILTLLKRRPECGNPCHLCERSCPVKAIEPTGKIKMAECFQCLDCMVEYHDDKRCPPLSRIRKQRERQATTPRPTTWPEAPDAIPAGAAARVMP